MKTKPQQFKIWFNLLTKIDIEPWLIPLTEENKFPDVPKGESWKEERFRLTKEQAIDRLKNEKNVGFVPKGRIALIDVDDLEKADDILNVEDMPTALACESRSGKPHLYFKNGGLGNKEISDDGDTVIEVRTRDRYGVAPGSFVPSDEGDGLYKVIEPEIPGTLEPKHLPKSLRPNHCETLKEEKELDILKVIPTEGLHNEGNRLQGPHPIHGSNHTKRNFSVNPDKNVWHCHRHNSGGGPFSYIAMEEGIIACEEAKKGALRGDVWKETVKIAKDRGLISKEEATKLSGAKIETEFTPSVVNDDFLAEEIYRDGDLKYAVYYKDNEEVKIQDEIRVGNKTYKPIEDDTVEKGAVFLPSGVIEYEDIDSLLNEIKEFIDKWVDISEKFKEMAAWYVLLTWVYDRLSVIPYLRFKGDFGTGKTRGLRTIGKICYKAIDTGGATTSAGVERMVERWKGTVLMNEADFMVSDTRANIIKLLNEGYEKEGVIIKANTENQDKIVMTEPYSPKILATRREWEDSALESRCITEKMHQTNRLDILPITTSEFKEKQQELRNKLLMYRFKNRGEIDSEQIKEVWPRINALNVDRRLVQATINFSILFSHDEEMFGRFTDFLTTYQKELVRSRGNTFEGGIVRAIDRLQDDGIILSPSNIAESMERDDNYSDVEPTKVGGTIRNLSLKTSQKRVNDKNRRVISNSDEEIERVKKRYIESYVTPSTPVTPVTGAEEDFEGGEASDTPTPPLRGVTRVTGVTIQEFCNLLNEQYLEEEEIIKELDLDKSEFDKIISELGGNEGVIKTKYENNQMRETLYSVIEDIEVE